MRFTLFHPKTMADLTPLWVINQDSRGDRLAFSNPAYLSMTISRREMPAGGSGLFFPFQRCVVLTTIVSYLFFVGMDATCWCVLGIVLSILVCNVDLPLMFKLLLYCQRSMSNVELPLMFNLLLYCQRSMSNFLYDLPFTWWGLQVLTSESSSLTW